MPNRPGARYKSSVGRKGSKGPFAQHRVDLLPSALVMHGRPWRKFPLRRERVRSIHDQPQACPEFIHNSSGCVQLASGKTLWRPARPCH
jgi:hypothetical protein